MTRHLMIRLESDTVTDTHCGECPYVHERGPGSGYVFGTCDYFGPVVLERADDLLSAKRSHLCVQAEI